MAISSYKVFLMKSADGESAWEKMVDIKDFPDLGGAPEQLETTTLSDKMQTFINGIQKLDTMSFTANYDKATYDTLLTDAGKAGHYAVWFGGSDAVPPVPSGDQGKWKWDGSYSIYVSGAGVDEVVDMIITMTPSTPIDADKGV